MLPDTGRAGGFGWAAQSAAACFRRNLAPVDVVYLNAASGGERRSVGLADGVRLIPSPRRLADLATLRRERLDAILSIDYRPNYRPFFLSLPRTPIFVWARDPRTPEDVAHVKSLRVPGAEGARPKGVREVDIGSLGTIVEFSRILNRPLLLAAKTPQILAKIPLVYGVPASGIVLPNPSCVQRSKAFAPKSAHPRVVFLGRLDPIKRPWIFVELARHFPEVEFMLAGPAHFSGVGGWEPTDLPDNVRAMGLVGGSEKFALLQSSWLLVNTSIHEETPVSMIESLACGTPVVACLDTGEIATRFGFFAGRFGGTGLDAIPRLAEGIRGLLDDPERRRSLGEDGREWVAREHGDEPFLAAFDMLCRTAGIVR